MKWPVDLFHTASVKLTLHHLGRHAELCGTSCTDIVTSVIDVYVQVGMMLSKSLLTKSF